MNSRLAALMAKITPPRGRVILDCYNQAVIEGVAMTVTTRIDAANMYYLLEPPRAAEAASRRMRGVIDGEGDDR